MSPLRRRCRLPASFSRSFVAPLGPAAQTPLPVAAQTPLLGRGTGQQRAQGGWGSSSQEDSSLQPARGGTHCEPALPTAPSALPHRPSRPCALQCISWLICVIAIKLLLLEVPSVVSGMRLGSCGLGSGASTGRGAGWWGCPSRTKASVPPEWLIGKLSP